LLLAIEAGFVTPLVSVTTAIKYEAVHKRLENLEVSRLDANDVDILLDAFVAHADHVKPHFNYRASIRDPDDEMFVSVAINGRADTLITFNVAGRCPAEAARDQDLPPRRHS
jgi:predicted nucleic acid-binding protein